MIRLYLITAILFSSVASCSKKFVKEEREVESYYLIHTFSTNSIDSSVIRDVYYLSFKKINNRYTEVIVKPENKAYLIKWTVKNDSIYLEESTSSASYRASWKFTKRNYIYSLNRLELFQSLPFNPYFHELENQYDYAKTDPVYTQFYSNVQNGITYKRQNIKTGIIDSLASISRTDIIKYVSYSIRPSSFDSLYFNSDLSVPLMPKQSKPLVLNEVDSIIVNLKGPKKYLLIDFGYVYCYPCRISWLELEKFEEFDEFLSINVLNPVDDRDLIFKVAKKYSPSISFIKCDMALVSHFQIKSYPTILLFDSKNEIIVRSDHFVDSRMFYDAVKTKIRSLEKR